MDFTTLAAARYSVRAYKPDPVPEEMLQRVLEAARLAPTAHNAQPFRLIVIHTRGREQELLRVYPREWFVQPPLVIAGCLVTTETWVRGDGKSYGEVDVAIVMDHLILAATSLGLGTCWIAAFNAAAAREALALPDHVQPVIFTPLGFPAIEPHEKRRRPLEELVLYERWG